MARYKETVVEPRREAMRAVIRRGMQTGELRPDTDVEIAMLTLTGACMAQDQSVRGDADDEFATRLVDGLLLGLSARS